MNLIEALIPSVIRRLDTLTRKADTIMATQDQLNTYVARLNAAVTDIAGDLTRLKADLAAHTDIDLSALDTAITQLEGVAAETPEPEAEFANGGVIGNGDAEPADTEA